MFARCACVGSGIGPAPGGATDLKEALMPTGTQRKLTDAERRERRVKQRERLEKACRELLTSDGWRRWVRVRSANGLSRYSFHNQCLLAVQARERGLELSYVAGFRAFLALGRAVRKGERALWVLAPHTVTIKRDERADATDMSEAEEEHRVFFRSVPVFDLAQTEELPGAQVVPLCPPGQLVDGDGHGHLVPRLIAHAEALGYRVEQRELPAGGPDGWCDHRAKLIVVGEGSANRRVRVLVHELAHAHGIGYEQYTRRQAEVLVDTVTHIVLAQAGLDVSGETVPYIAGWGGEGALDAIRAFAQTVDEVARKLEQVTAPAA
jgi:hypothetical protein